mgnify:CR=1 FL=1
MYRTRVRVSSINRKGIVLKIISRKTFRKVVNVSDRLNIWFKKTFGLDAKRKVLEAKQDLTTMDELDNTIGKALGIK